jgi:MFS transporter, OFA family, oxalate/formate antiporter
MPAFNADYFGSKNVGTIYGLMITAWGFGGVFGPTLISYMYDATGSYAGAFYVIAGIMLLSSIIPFFIRPRRGRPVLLPERRPEHSIEPRGSSV